VDEAFARELEAVEWFVACGKPFTVSLPFPMATVSSWSEAIEQCSDPLWEHVTLEARNELTIFLHAHHHDADQNWNVITDAAKERVITPLLDRVWRPFAARQGFGKVLLDCIAWDVLTAIMEHEYRDCVGRPEFFLHLLKVYRGGHFPCGWLGEWPKGQLLAW
jgi:hypothetical protein